MFSQHHTFQNLELFEMQTVWLPTSSSDSEIWRLVAGRFACKNSFIIVWKGIHERNMNKNIIYTWSP